MENSRPKAGSAVAVLGFAAFGLAIGAEFERMKEEDVKLDGALCYLPGGGAFGLGVAALACLFSAQVIGSAAAVCKEFCKGEEKRNCSSHFRRRPTKVSVLLLVSWISFGITSILLGAAASMNRKQAYGRGWLDGECYLVRDGVFIGSAMLALFTISATLVSLSIASGKSRVEGEPKVHAQVA